MDRVASLQKRASLLARRLFASQPLYVRVARVIEIVAGVNPLLSALGRALGAVFLLKRVQGLPDIHGKPAEQWFAEQNTTNIDRLSRKLPSDYLSQFAVRVRQTIGQRFRNEDMAMEALQGWLTRFVALNGWKTMDEGLTLDRARSYVLVGVKNEGLNLVKKRRHEDKQRSLDEMDADGERVRINPADPNALKDFLEEVPMWRAPRVRRILEQQAHPDAPRYLDLLLEGYTSYEIVGDWRKDIPSMLPHVQQKPVTPQAWEYKTMPKILEVLKYVARREMAV